MVKTIDENLMLPIIKERVSTCLTTKIQILIVLCFFYLQGYSQIIIGEIVSERNNQLEYHIGATISLDSISKISDFFGCFRFDSLVSIPNTISIKGIIGPKFIIYNLPQNSDTLDLGKIEIVEYETISVSEFDSIRLIEINNLKERHRISKRRLNSLDYKLNKKYNGVDIAVGGIIGFYINRNKLSKYVVRHPFDYEYEIELDWDSKKDIIRLNYNELYRKE